MGKAAPSGVKFVLAINFLMLLAFIWLSFVQPELTDLAVRMNYTQLDREGVVNADALAKFHASYGFSADPRNAVPRYIAGPALHNQRLIAFLGLTLATINLSGGVWMVMASRCAKRSNSPTNA